MAGGKGTRLQSVAKDIPKPMVKILDKPILEYQIISLKESGITDITIIIGHLGNVIQDYFNDGHKWEVTITYIIETTPLGTAGALFYVKDKIQDDFLLLFGDLLLDVDWNRFMEFHKVKGARVTMYAHPNAHPYDSDIIVIDKNKCVIAIDSKNNVRNYFYHNFVNAGIYCVSPEVLQCCIQPIKMDLEKDIILELITQNKVYAYKSTEYVKDMGTPDRLYAISQDVKNGIVASRSLKQKQKCVFLDRDGTINKLNGFLCNAIQFEFLPNVTEAIKLLNASEYLVIIATNQPVVARGECSFEELFNIHMKMETELGKKGAYVDDIYFCPHHPHKGYAGEVEELKIGCECRKPKIGMIIAAANQYNIDLSASWYIGDTTMDIQTGINAGMRTILLHTGEAGKDKKFNVVSDYEAKDLLEAVELFLRKRK